MVYWADRVRVKFTAALCPSASNSSLTSESSALQHRPIFRLFRKLKWVTAVPHHCLRKDSKPMPPNSIILVVGRGGMSSPSSGLGPCHSDESVQSCGFKNTYFCVFSGCKGNCLLDTVNWQLSYMYVVLSFLRIIADLEIMC